MTYCNVIYDNVIYKEPELRYERNYYLVKWMVNSLWVSFHLLVLSLNPLKLLLLLISMLMIIDNKDFVNIKFPSLEPNLTSFYLNTPDLYYRTSINLFMCHCVNYIMFKSRFEITRPFNLSWDFSFSEKVQ